MRFAGLFINLFKDILILVLTMFSSNDIIIPSKEAATKFSRDQGREKNSGSGFERQTATNKHYLIITL